MLFSLIVNRFDQKKTLRLSNVIFIVSLATMLMVTVPNSANPLSITLAFLVFVIGQIIPTTILYPLALNFLPEAKGRVAAIMQALRLIFSSFALQMAGYFYDGSFQRIGWILSAFIIAEIVTLACVIKSIALWRR